jgi:hypothetical protein
MGSTGSVTAAADGTWYAAFNDDFRGDNSGSYTLKVPAPTVTFTNYDLCAGFDDWTEFQTGGDNKVWISVPQSGNNTVRAIITPAEQAQTIGFTNLTPNVATASPSKATSTNQELTVTGTASGAIQSADIHALFLGTTATGFHADVLPRKTNVTVALYRVIASTMSNSPPTNVPTQTDVKAYLDSVYGRQANVFFTVLPMQEVVVPYDGNGNDAVDWSDSFTGEPFIIYTFAHTNALNVYYVNALSNATEQAAGVTYLNYQATFIQDSHFSSSTNITAHELGHSLADLEDVGPDNALGLEDRLMWHDGLTADPCRLIRPEWKAVNESAP